jgi:hypothetical protein
MNIEERNKQILAALLLKEADEEESGIDDVGADTQEETPKEDMTPFEIDPMGYILKKYVTLNGVLSELMTPSFVEYLDGIFIVAPKPTTFKIQLHNGAHFFLTYMGKAYQATVGGKDYYLMTIGEKERCMQAIARMLRYGSPINTKGPEGSEQGTRDDEFGAGGGAGGASDGGEFGYLGAEAGAAANPPGVNPAGGGDEGGEEDLSEARILEAILASKAVRQGNLFFAIKAALDAKGNKGKADSKHGRHLRYALGDDRAAIKSIESALEDINRSMSLRKDIDPKKFYKIDTIEANEYPKGAKSGKFKTYKVTVTKDIPGASKGEEVFIVNQFTSKSTIPGKSLTPTNLNLSGKTFRTSGLLIKTVNEAISSSKNPNLAKLLNGLMVSVEKNTKRKFNDVAEAKKYTETIQLNDEATQSITKFSESDINAIGKDFGEILGAITLMKSVKTLSIGIEFPGGNEPLADFLIDGYKISSKYAGGASAALTSIVKGIDEKQLAGKSQKSLFKVLNLAVQNSTPSGYIEIGKYLNTPGTQKLAEILKVPQKELSVELIKSEILKTIKGAKSNQDKDTKLLKRFGQFYELIKRRPKKGANMVVDWDALRENNIYGVIIGPLSYYIADYLNTIPEYKKALIELLSKVEVKQMYLNFSLKSKTATFTLKPFTDPGANFIFDIGSQSVYNPSSSKLGFKLK